MGGGAMNEGEFADEYIHHDEAEELYGGMPSTHTAEKIPLFDLQS